MAPERAQVFLIYAIAANGVGNPMHFDNIHEPHTAYDSYLLDRLSVALFMPSFFSHPLAVP